MLKIASALPGRIRLRLTDKTMPLPALATACRSLDAVTSVRINAAAHSLVLTFDSAACDLPSMLVRLATVAPLPTMPSGVRMSPSRYRRPRPLKLRLNRIAKLGALSSLAASLVWAASGNKRLHVASGFVFLGFLATHLAVYRRNLTR